MEMIKNGHFMDAKYESKIVIMDVPHVIVLANKMPDTACLSQDRWSVYQLHVGIPRLIMGQRALSWKGCAHLRLTPPKNATVTADDLSIDAFDLKYERDLAIRLQKYLGKLWLNVNVQGLRTIVNGKRLPNSPGI